MTPNSETRTLSSDELDAVSGGVQMDGCTKNGSFSFLGVKFTTLYLRRRWLRRERARQGLRLRAAPRPPKKPGRHWVGKARLSLG